MKETKYGKYGDIWKTISGGDRDEREKEMKSVH